MAAITLDTARNVAVGVVLVLVALAVLSAILLRSIAQKVALVVIFGLLALLVWSQRSSLEDCADRVREALAAGELGTDTTCSFLGQDVTIQGRPDE